MADHSSLSSAHVRLEVRSSVRNKSEDDEFDRDFTLTPKDSIMIVGRSSRRHTDRGKPASNNATFDSPVISREHAKIWLETQQLMMKDLGSLHGTNVNGVKLRPHIAVHLKAGDEVIVGSEVASADRRFTARGFRVTFDLVNKLYAAYKPKEMTDTNKASSRPLPQHSESTASSSAVQSAIAPSSSETAIQSPNVRTFTVPDEPSDDECLVVSSSRTLPGSSAKNPWNLDTASEAFPLHQENKAPIYDQMSSAVTGDDLNKASSQSQGNIRNASNTYGCYPFYNDEDPEDEDEDLDDTNSLSEVSSDHSVGEEAAFGYDRVLGCNTFPVDMTNTAVTTDGQNNYQDESWYKTILPEYSDSMNDYNEEDDGGDGIDDENDENDDEEKGDNYDEDGEADSLDDDDEDDEEVGGDDDEDEAFDEDEGEDEDEDYDPAFELPAGLPDVSKAPDASLSLPAEPFLSAVHANDNNVGSSKQPEAFASGPPMNCLPTNIASTTQQQQAQQAYTEPNAQRAHRPTKLSIADLLTEETPSALPVSNGNQAPSHHVQYTPYWNPEEWSGIRQPAHSNQSQTGYSWPSLPRLSGPTAAATELPGVRLAQLQMCKLMDQRRKTILCRKGAVNQWHGVGVGGYPSAVWPQVPRLESHSGTTPQAQGSEQIHGEKRKADQITQTGFDGEAPKTEETTTTHKDLGEPEQETNSAPEKAVSEERVTQDEDTSSHQEQDVATSTEEPQVTCSDENVKDGGEIIGIEGDDECTLSRPEEMDQPRVKRVRILTPPPRAMVVAADRPDRQRARRMLRTAGTLVVGAVLGGVGAIGLLATLPDILIA